VAFVTDEHKQLLRARETAREVQRAAAQLAEFAQRLSPVLDPAEIAEYDALVAREAAAISQRVTAFAALGLAAASIDDEA
jgi:hypothetical protein